MRAFILLLATCHCKRDVSDNVRCATLTKDVSLLEGGREVHSHKLIRQVRFSLPTSSQESFQVPIFIHLKILSFGELGLS